MPKPPYLTPTMNAPYTTISFQKDEKEKPTPKYTLIYHSIKEFNFTGQDCQISRQPCTICTENDCIWSSSCSSLLGKAEVLVPCLIRKIARRGNCFALQRSGYVMDTGSLPLLLARSLPKVVFLGMTGYLRGRSRHHHIS